MEHPVVVPDDGGVVDTRAVDRSRVGAVGPVAKAAPIALVVPSDGGREVHVVPVEEPGAHHRDEEPHGVARAVDAAERGHVRVPRIELRHGGIQVHVDDVRHDDGAADERACRFDEARVLEEGFESRELRRAVRPVASEPRRDDHRRVGLAALARVAEGAHLVEVREVALDGEVRPAARDEITDDRAVLEHTVDDHGRAASFSVHGECSFTHRALRCLRRRRWRSRSPKWPSQRRPAR